MASATSAALPAELLTSSTSIASASPPAKSISLTGKILIGLSGGIACAATIVCYPFVAPAFRRYCLPYVPATTTQVENVLQALAKRPTAGRLLDIGSGDGRIVVAAAKHGFVRSDGVELNPWLVQWSRAAALFGGVSARTAFYRRDLWTYDLQPYRNIVVFGVEQMMEELERKLQREVTDRDTQIVVCRFPLPNVRAHRIIGGGVDTVWVYNLHQQPPPESAEADDGRQQAADGRTTDL